MASMKTVGEVIDVIVIAVFLIIFVQLINPYISTLIGAPSANNLANLLALINKAYTQNQPSLYSLVLNSGNNYNVFGNDIYLTQIIPTQEDKNDDSTPQAIRDNCLAEKTCTCLINIQNCVDTICSDFRDSKTNEQLFRLSSNCGSTEYQDRSIELEGNTKCCVKNQQKWRILPIKSFEDFRAQDFSQSQLNPEDMRTVTTQDYTLEDYTKEFLQHTKCDANAVYIRVMTCSQLVEDAAINPKLILNEDQPIILFPNGLIQTEAESVDIEIRRADDDMQFSRIIKIDTG